jgi:hypothetical protein
LGVGAYFLGHEFGHRLDAVGTGLGTEPGANVVAMDEDPSALIFQKPVDLLALVFVTLNGGPIENNHEYKSGYLSPGYRGGRELHYFKISRDAMVFWKFVCRHLRHTYRVQALFFASILQGNRPVIETWTPQDECPNWYDDDHVRYVPRHFYAGDPKPWMNKLCYGPQNAHDALAAEAQEDKKLAKETCKQKIRESARRSLEVMFPGGGAFKRVLRARK